MTTLTTGNIITGMFSQIQNLIGNYSNEGYHALSSSLSVSLSIAISLYIVLMGIAILQGFVEMKMKELVVASLKIAVVYTAAMNWDWVNEYFITLVNSVVTDVSNVMVSVGNSDISSLDGGVSDGLQIAFNRIMELAQTYAKEASVRNMWPIVESGFIALLGSFVVAIAAAEILISMTFMDILFALTPLMMILYLFTPTKSMFGHWLNLIFGNGMAIILVSSVVGLILVMLGWVFPDAMPNAEDLNFMTSGAAIIICFVSILLLFKAAGVGRAIAGGSSSASGMAAGMIMGATVLAGKKIADFIDGKTGDSKNKNKKNDKSGSAKQWGKAARVARSRIRNKPDNEEGK